jgi:hypothetical protein
MCSDVVTARAHDRPALRGELRLGVQWFFAQNEKIAFGHAISVPAAAD